MNNKNMINMNADTNGNSISTSQHNHQHHHPAAGGEDTTVSVSSAERRITLTLNEENTSPFLHAESQYFSFLFDKKTSILLKFFLFLCFLLLLGPNQETDFDSSISLPDFEPRHWGDTTGSTDLSSSMSSSEEEEEEENVMTSRDGGAGQEEDDEDDILFRGGFIDHLFIEEYFYGRGQRLLTRMEDDGNMQSSEMDTFLSIDEDAYLWMLDNKEDAKDEDEIQDRERKRREN